MRGATAVGRGACATTGSARMSRRPMPAIAEEEAEPLAAVEHDGDEDRDDAADAPEIEADMNADRDPAIVRD
jgi:hypothetical protein